VSADAVSAAAAAAAAAAYAAAANAAYTTAAAAAYAAYAAAYAAYAFTKYNIDIDALISDDIEKIRSGVYFGFDHDTKIYGAVWGDFQDSLREIGCHYWADWYEKLFAKGFALDGGDREEIETRLNIPLEIRAQGAEGVAHYMEQLKQGSERLNEARVIILGEKGAGKTCLARRLINPGAPMTEAEESTEGVDTTVWKINGDSAESTVNAHIWDFAGHVITHAAHRCFLSERCLYIIVYDGRSERRNHLEYWLDHVQNYGGKAPVRILVNLRDGNTPDIAVNTLKKKYPFIQDFVYLSIRKDKKKLSRFREETAEFIRSNLTWNRQEIPSNYFAVKEALEKLFEEREGSFSGEHISKDAFDEIAAGCGVERGGIEHVLKALHELGICLWYQELAEFDMLVLNPGWITHGIYKLINWAHNNKRYAVSIGDCKKIFQDEPERYPAGKLQYIFKLMKKYELAYSEEPAGDITIPFLLKEDQPETLPDFPIDDSLMIQYKAEQKLPPNTVSRFIVLHHLDIRAEHEVWRYGAVLKYGNDTVALVQEEERKVTVSVKGGGKGEYIAKLRETLNYIFGSYKSNKPELLYRVIDVGPRYSSPHDIPPIMLENERLVRTHVNGKSLYDDIGDRDIPLLPTINAYKVEIIQNYGYIGSLTRATINIQNCNFSIQGDLNSLIRAATSKGETGLAEELREILGDITEAEEIKSKPELIKSGLMGRLCNFLEEIGDENSKKRKILEGASQGLKIAQKVAQTYNSIAKDVGLPKVPAILVGKGDAE
ncbi:MAG: hypothetical protein FWH06_04560, partial [Oscillospiraceae bacterium]|nr:hypothetical protein [Oscillospiraceae bacterium]